MSNMVGAKRTQWGIAAFVAVFAALNLLPIHALAAASQSISQGFRASGELGVGMLVSYRDEESEVAVAAATPDRSERLVGVAGENALIELSDGTTQTQVITNGFAMALVSDINGEVSAGDKITISPIPGVGMKILENGTIVGTAQESFSSAENIRNVEVTDRTGSKKTVQVGLLPIQVSVTYYQQPDTGKSILPQFILELARVISGGRQVSVVRVIVALIVLLTGILVIGVLVYTSVRSSILSIGRNPLAAKAVHRSLFEVGAMSAGILLIMLIAVYLVLIT
jgi:hypothetical protein